ncbi:MAG: head-tail connector protein [Devosia sp.]
MITQTWRLALNCAPKLVLLPIVPVASLVDAPDGAVLQADAVLLDAAGEDISIDFIAGYGAAADVPQDLKQALLALVAYWFENRDTSTVTIPAGFDRLVAGYRRVKL